MTLGTRGGKEDYPVDNYEIAVDNYEIAVDKLRICSRPVDATSTLAQSMHRQGRIRRSHRRTLNRKAQGKAGAGTLGGAPRKRRPTEVPLRGEGRPQGRPEPRGTDRSSCRPQGGGCDGTGAGGDAARKGANRRDRLGPKVARKGGHRGKPWPTAEERWHGRPSRSAGLRTGATNRATGQLQGTHRPLGTIAISRRPREAWRRKPTSYPGLFRIPSGAPRASSWVSTVPGGL